MWVLLKVYFEDISKVFMSETVYLCQEVGWEKLGTYQ